MNVLFLSLLDFQTIEEHNIYTDLLREFRKNGYTLYIVSPVERKKKQRTHILKESNCTILKLKIGNIQKTNYLEKGISLLQLQGQFIRGIKNYFPNVRFDLILYATPPINLQRVVEYVKKRDKAITYLMLKDIWPQGIVDLGILGKNSILCKYFKRKETQMYMISDYIGCMSENNVKYLIAHNAVSDNNKIEICPNSIEPMPLSTISREEILTMRERYQIPKDKIVLLFGGNLGRPQGIDFLLQIIQAYQGNTFFFLIVGDGTEYEKVRKGITEEHKDKALLIKYLPKEEYERIVQLCDVGLIFLAPQFTVPNIPSRILSYMQASLPMLAATDSSTDLQRIFSESEMGYWCLNGDVTTFLYNMNKLIEYDERVRMGQNARKYLENHYTAHHSYKIIEKHLLEKSNYEP